MSPQELIIGKAEYQKPNTFSGVSEHEIRELRRLVDKLQAKVKSLEERIRELELL